VGINADRLAVDEAGQGETSSIQVNTSRWVSTAISRRVRQIVG
jgi:hypothetical protein